MSSHSTGLGARSAGDRSYDVRTGEAQGLVGDSDPAAVTRALEEAATAARAMASAGTRARQVWLEALATAVEAQSEEPVTLADRERGLGVPRLTGEVARMAMQTRFYAEVTLEGSRFGATIDKQVGNLSGLRRANQPLGPVAVVGASNFPFAFALLGNDTASALGAGCPVVAKAHPAPPALCQRLAEIAVEVLRGAGAPAGCFATVTGFASGQMIVKAPQITAVAFTGSQRGGMALWSLANEREVVIPVFAEMGTINPGGPDPGRSGPDAGGGPGFRRVLRPGPWAVLHQARSAAGAPRRRGGPGGGGRRKGDGPVGVDVDRGHPRPLRLRSGRSSGGWGHCSGQDHRPGCSRGPGREPDGLERGGCVALR